MYFVYAIYNKKHNKIYIGQSDNIEIRIDEHNNHMFRKCFTARFDGKWIEIYEEKCDTRAEAIRREKQLKSYRGREFVKQYIPKE